MSARDHVSDRQLTFSMSYDLSSGLSPCKDCKERGEGCHSKCLKYVAYSLAQDSKYECRAEWQGKRCAAFNHVQDSMKRAKNNGFETGYYKVKKGKRFI